MRTMETKRFSQDWLFHSGNTPWWQPTGEKFDAVLDRWHRVALPHTFNAEDTFTPARGFYRGICWYRKTFDLSTEDAGRKVFLEFGAGFSLVNVWVNERHAGQFMGGYTGFVVDATELVCPGENLIGIKVDNSQDPDILPGLEGCNMDYVVYGGLYREASLVLKNKVHIPANGITVTTPSVSTERASLQVEVAVRNDSEENKRCEVVGILRGASGKATTEMSGSVSLAGHKSGTVTLERGEVSTPDLWSIEEPNLYSLDIELRLDGKTIDSDSTPVGFRWFEFTAEEGFFLNGKHVKLRGLNRHQDYPGLGNALPVRMQVRDAEILKEMGANFVRLSHYPQHPAFLDACDRFGVLVYEEIASWQYIGGEMFTRNAEYMMREMIARDKNHPCVILWGLLNEGRSKPLFERLHNIAKECDPTRPTIYADNHPEEGKEKGSAFVPDVLGVNYKLPHLDEIHASLPSCKLVSSETTNYEHRRRGDVNHDIGQVEKFKIDTDIIEERGFMAGMALWSMHDYGTDYELSWPIQNSGVLDCYRLPRGGYWFLRSRWSSEPVVRIIGHWNWTGREGEKIPILVCSNGKSVELFLNGESLGSRTGENLLRWEVPFSAGTLRAVAKRGECVVEHALISAEEPVRLVIDSSCEEMEADGSDVAEITLTVADKAGHPVLTEDGYAVFRVEGPARIRGIAGIPCTPILAGVGRIAIQATAEPGIVTVRAAYRGLPEAAITLESK